MSKVHPALDADLVAFLEAQHLFFVATAPLSEEGHVNVSPKGHDSFRVLDPHTVAYLDLTGSGAETMAPLRENGRICLLFCAFEGKPKIVRIHGQGEVLEPGHPDFAALSALFPDLPGARSIVRVRATRVSDSCGFSVPRFDFAGERTDLLRWAEKRGPVGLARYRAERNAASIDGLPAVDSSEEG